MKRNAHNRLNDKYIKLYHEGFIYNSYAKPHIFVQFTDQLSTCSMASDTNDTP